MLGIVLIVFELVQKVEIIVLVIVVLDGSEKGKLFGIVGDFLELFVCEESLSHFSKVSSLPASARFLVVFGVGEVKVATTFLAKSTVVDISVEFLNRLFVTGSFFAPRDGQLMVEVKRRRTRKRLLALSR